MSVTACQLPQRQLAIDERRRLETPHQALAPGRGARVAPLAGPAPSIDPLHAFGLKVVAHLCLRNEDHRLLGQPAAHDAQPGRVRQTLGSGSTAMPCKSA